MKTSARGVAAIALHEGVVTKAYQDVAGIWTIGVGHTAAAGEPYPKAGMTITRAEAMRILADDIAKFETRVDRAFPKGIPQHAYDGAVSFDFNTGRIHDATWAALYRQGKMAAAEASLKRWNRADNNVVQGLINRRNAEADLIFRGQYPSGMSVVEFGPIPSSSYDDPEIIRGYQQQLAELGIDTGPADGIRGPKTKAALMTFQERHGLVVDGVYGPATKATLDRVHGERLGPDPSKPDDIDDEPDTLGTTEGHSPGWLARLIRWIFNL